MIIIGTTAHNTSYVFLCVCLYFCMCVFVCALKGMSTLNPTSPPIPRSVLCGGGGRQELISRSKTVVESGPSDCEEKSCGADG